MEAVAAPTEINLAAPRTRQPAPSIQRIAAAFPHLEVIELIGEGGMGAVYKARQPKLNRFVALKILPESLAQDPAFAERFAREGQLLARLNHPNIVTVHDFGQSGGFFHLLMEFVDGVNLRQAMNAGRFSAEQALAIVPKICEALQFAHDEGVLHRDIKPENILLDARGRVKLVDFGIAKLIGRAESESVAGDAPSATSLTQSGAALGTPNYMAPEQVARPAEVDHRADIYSLGVVFYELLTGELPTAGFARPSEKTPVSADVDAIVMRALEQERERRQQSATELKTEVENIQPAASSGAPQPVPPVIPSDDPTPLIPPRRPRSLVIVASLFILGGCLAAGEIGRDFHRNVFDFNLGILGLPVGIGLLRLRPWWRRAGLVLISAPVALVLLWGTWMAFKRPTLVTFSKVEFLGRELTGGERTAAVVLGVLLGLGLLVWIYQVLLRRDVKSLFRRRGFTRPWIEWAALGAALGLALLVHWPSREAGGKLTTAETAKAPEFVIELGRGWMQTNVNALHFSSQSSILPGQSVVAMVRNVEGQYAPANSTVSIQNRGGHSVNSLQFAWSFPTSFSRETQESAWTWINLNHIHRPLRLVAGQPFELFSATNDSGGVMSGFLEYRVISDQELSQVQSKAPPIRAVVRLRPQPAMSGWQTLYYSARIPEGHVLQGICRGTAASDGEALTRFGNDHPDSSCTWFIRGDFTLEHFRQGTAQLERLRASGPLEVALGAPRLLFALTNDAGETFEGWLELLAPARGGTATSPAAPALTTGAPGKVVVLTGATNSIRGEQNEVRTVTVRTDTRLFPGERLLALRRNPDGQIVGSSTSFFLQRRRGISSTSTYLTWFVPESFEPALLESAALQIQGGFSDRPLNLPSGETLPLFSITNQVGGTLAGLIRFERETLPHATVRGTGGSPPTNIIDEIIQGRISQQFGDRATLMTNLRAQGITFEAYRQRIRDEMLPALQAIVRIRRNSTMRILYYSATVPLGYFLEATAAGPEPIEGDSSTSMSFSASGADFHCSWRPPNSFQSDDLKSADAQIQLLAAKGPLAVSPGQPQRVFSVTNQAGEVFEGRFELFGP